jgi:hypothetical protein
MIEIERFFKELLALTEAAEMVRSYPFMTNSHEPRGKVAEGDVVIGILPEGLQRWYMVYIASQDELNLECAQVDEQLREVLNIPSKNRTDEQCSFARNHQLMHDEQELIDKLFWFSVKKVFPMLVILEDGCKIVICEGWKVVVRRQLREASWGAERPLARKPSAETPVV